MSLGFLISLAWPVALCSQRPSQSDTTRLDEVIISAERAPSAVGSSVSAVTRLSGAELARMPNTTFADILRMVPGFSVVDFDGLGDDPQLTVRGFYGGGEAEYVVVLVDGRLVNQLHTGAVAWNVLPPIASIKAIEIVRGGGSSLYGDAAIAGIINVITRGERTTKTKNVRLEAAGGSHGTFRAAADLTAPSLWKGTSLSGALDRTAGFRQNARRNTLRAHGRAGLFETDMSRFAVTLASNWRSFDEPGPLLDSLLAVNRRASDDLFRFDHTRDQTHALVLDGEHRFGIARLSGSATAEYRSFDAIRTIAVAPGFGDTDLRDATTTRGAIGAQAQIDESPLPGRDRLIMGAEASHGALRSKYYEILTADRSSYPTAVGSRGALEARGSSRRGTVALYADYSIHPLSTLRLSLGARLDRLRDGFEPGIPADGTRMTDTRSAFSPKGGVNFQYLNARGRTGNAYLAMSRSFKAPTLDQLYDQRQVPIPFPPFKITTSNPTLQSQRGTSVEAGVYHGTNLWAGAQLSASISGYQIDMSNELDFDVTTLQYVNIGRSRHRGLEASANVEEARWSAFLAYTLQAATSRAGASNGNQLKAIPRHTINAGLSTAPTGRLSASLLISHLRSVYLDDANVVALPNYSRVDLRIGMRAFGRSVFAEARNLLDIRYSSTGFVDPAGSGHVYFYPAAERTLAVGVRSGL
jgi:outer membrane cobalamin receptor